MPDYTYNLSIRAVYQSEKVAGAIAQVIGLMLKSGIAEYTPQFGAGHWSLRFPDLEVRDIKNLLSKFAKVVLK